MKHKANYDIAIAPTLKGHCQEFGSHLELRAAISSIQTLPYIQITVLGYTEEPSLIRVVWVNNVVKLGIGSLKASKQY